MLNSRLAIATALCLAVAGCVSGSGTQRLEREGNATLTGVVLPPPGARWRGSPPCAGVRVRVAHASEPTRPLGSVLVKQSRERCLYVVSSLPSEAELRLEVSLGEGWRCEDGEAPSLTPTPGSLRLRDYETATRDFRATCG
ncbi:MAG: hypothetical protein JXB05_30130 [Myxococcaceae bacterium]|nr:hypothetical protein [Myxococcaceae bacterium]